MIWNPERTWQAQCTKLQKCLSQVLEGTPELSGEHAPWNTLETSVPLQQLLVFHSVSLYHIHGPLICSGALRSLHPVLYFPTF